MYVIRDSRRTAKISSLLLLAALGALAPTAHAVTPASGGWTSRGASAASRSSGTNPAEENPWRLPNGQVVPAPTNAAPAPSSNSLRNGQATNQLREPRSLSTPVNAQPIVAAQRPANSPKNNTAQQHTPSSAIVPAAANMPAGRPANLTTRPMAQPQFSSPRVARAMSPRGMSSPRSSRASTRMNIAMNGPEWTDQAENLPMPGPTMKSGDSYDPFVSDPNAYYLEGDGPMPAGCGPGCECGEVCGCGDACEPGCGCSDGCCGDPCCNDCFSIGPGDPESCHSIRIRAPRWQELAIFAGVQGFKGPYDQDRDAGNFGFHEGFNSGFKIPYTYMGYQIGYQATQNDLNGDEGIASPESHTQHFTTFGLYRRATDGLQFGSVWDTLVDRRHNARTFHQLRNELSWVDCGIHEFGVSATIGIMDHEDPQNDEIDWGAVDQYLLFYRIHGKTGGEGRFYAGWTDDSDGIIGADMDLPVHDRWSVMSGFTYMIPDARDGIDGANEEAWNISLALVWHWDCRARKSYDNPYRPLFNVANNGYMIIDNRNN